MSEEILEPEIQPENTETIPEEVQEAQEVSQAEPEPQKEQNFEHNAFEENVKSLREAKKREEERAAQAEYERDQLAKYVENIQHQLKSPQQPQNDIGIKDDEYVEGKHLGKVTSKMKQMEQQLQQWKAYSEEMTAELKLNNEFSDFSEVVTADNVKSFLKEHPEMRSSVQNNDPLYNRGKATYKLIKKFMKDDKKSSVNKNNQKKVYDNTGKPRPTSSIKEKENSPLSHANLFANGYSEEVGAKLEEEMYDAISRY